MKLSFLIVFLFMGIIQFSCNTEKPNDSKEYPNYQLIWSDEFNEDALDTSVWNYEIGTGANGWGNNELEYYTDRKENIHFSSGNLVIEARKEEYKGSKYTSARITTQNKKDFQYGRIDMRAKLPIGQGVWPALWMLGGNISEVGWPKCGEIDIMELIGKHPSRVFGTLHWEKSTGGHDYLTKSYDLKSGSFADKFHLFSLIWNKDSIKILVDNHPFSRINLKDISTGINTFRAPFFLLFNVAVGGNWPGNPDSSTTFPKRMYVDYVRVFEKIKKESSEKTISDTLFYEVGHRGARGLVPENTIPSFEKAIAVGANTIEFDVHITKDQKVVVYHDNSFNPAYTTKPDGSSIQNRKQFTFYQMDYADIRQFIIGEKSYSAFPEQVRMKSYAPLLTEMIDSIEQFTKSHHYPPVIYLLEVKSNPKTDGFEQPNPEEYMRIMMDKLKPYMKKLKGRLIVQSFDIRPLQVLHRTHPTVPLGFLVGGHNKTVDEHIEDMGFTPEFYNPHYALVNPDFIEKCHQKNMKIMVWTVEKKKRMKQLIKMGVDGIITDYPNRLQAVRDNQD